MTLTFRKEIGEALGNPSLAGALGRFYEAYPTSRAKAYQGIDFEAVRARIAEAKGDAAGHLPELVARFTKEAGARGAKVVVLKSPEEVRRYVVDLARERGVKRIVKSKSMASEEVHLNKALTDAGVDVKETDLGEWIIQLAGQRPSHMVMPAIHLTKEDVADIFSKEVGERLSTDIPRLVKVAKKELRPAFLEADMGISGANIAVAETGTLVIVTRRERAPGHDPAAHPRRHRWPGEAARALRGRGPHPHGPPAKRDRPADDELRLDDHRRRAEHRRDAEGAAHRPDGSPAERDGGRPRLQGGAAMHPLRLLPQRLPVYRHVGDTSSGTSTRAASEPS
jgi:L-lactate utilization protein LutC